MNEQEKKQLFSREYSELFDFVYRYVRYRLPQKEEAEDLVSEVFLQAYHKLSEFDPIKGGLRQWMTGIAKNKLLMHWRRRVVKVDLDSVGEITNEDDKQALAFLDSKLLVEKLLSHVSDDMKALLAFRYVDGLTFDDIAQVIGKEGTAVRQCFSRLHKKLQEIYEEIYA